MAIKPYITDYYNKYNETEKNLIQANEYKTDWYKNSEIISSESQGPAFPTTDLAAHWSFFGPETDDVFLDNTYPGDLNSFVKGTNNVNTTPDPAEGPWGDPESAVIMTRGAFNKKSYIQLTTGGIFTDSDKANNSYCITFHCKISNNPAAQQRIINSAGTGAVLGILELKTDGKIYWPSPNLTTTNPVPLNTWFIIRLKRAKNGYYIWEINGEELTNTTYNPDITGYLAWTIVYFGFQFTATASDCSMYMSSLSLWKGSNAIESGTSENSELPYSA